jgi:signal transduction histidine kinase
MDSWRRHFSSLRVLILATLVASVMVASLLAYWDQADRLRSDYSAQVSTDLDRLAELTALAMREPLWQFVPKQAESIIDSVFVNPGVLLVEVKDHKNLIFVYRARDGLSAQQASGEVVVKVTDIERDGTLVGHLRVVMSTSGYHQQLIQAQNRYLRFALIVLATSVLIVFTVMQFSLVLPIKRLVADALQIAHGELRTPIAPVFSMELGQLSSSLEITRESLLRLFSELELQNAALNDANENLESRVAERTRSLEDALVQLRFAQQEMIQSEKLASLGRVVAGVAHELNTPIGNALTVASTIASHLDALHAQVETGTLRKSVLLQVTDESRQAVGIFVRNIERAAQMIANFKQVAVDQSSDRRRVFDSAVVTQEVLSTLSPALRKANCTLSLDLQPDIRCDGFPGAYGQVLTNLVMNAVVHGYPQGIGGVIEVTTGAGSVPDSFELCVKELGEGMDAETSRRIYDPFFTTKLGQGGTGLGMNIVHGLVLKTLQGQISVHSEPGKGTVVRVQFMRTAGPILR